ncbi:MAG: Asp-tRNA(Asn)/Glu-tRNA(Gln) amidotransferase subunit GatA [Planctomyces sp.]
MSLTFLETHDLHEQLTSGSLTSRDLTAECLAQIRQHNARLNAFVHLDEDAALQQAEEIDRRRQSGQTVGILAGLPVALKDNICQRHVPTTCGSEMLKTFRPPYDAHVVERLRAADGVIIGKVNLDEFAMGSSTETSCFGASRNPWNDQHSAGGSSGGAAVAVASGMVPLSLGSDTGGSIRQPASFCGIVGMKPTYGRVSRYGLVAYASSLDQIGPFARDAAGAALLLQAIGGHDHRDTTSLTEPLPSLMDEIRKPLRGLRIGSVEEHFGEGISPDVQTAVRRAVDALETAGGRVVPVKLPHSKYSIATYYLIASSEASSNLARYDGIHYGHRAEKFADLVDLYCQSRGESFGAEVKRRIMLGTYALSAGYYDAYYLRALKVRRRIREDFDKAFENVDVIAGPVAPTAAFRLGEKLNDPLSMYLSDIYTISANLAGIPGISVPCGFTAEHLPVGLQLLAPALHDARLLQVAHQYQQLTMWHQQYPVMKC